MTPAQNSALWNGHLMHNRSAMARQSSGHSCSVLINASPFASAAGSRNNSPARSIKLEAIFTRQESVAHSQLKFPSAVPAKSTGNLQRVGRSPGTSRRVKLEPVTTTTGRTRKLTPLQTTPSGNKNALKPFLDRNPQVKRSRSCDPVPEKKETKSNKNKLRRQSSIQNLHRMVY